MHIETINLLDGDYVLVPANTTTPESVSLIYTDLNQDPNQCSEEPKDTFKQCQRRQAPEHNPTIFPNYHSAIYLLMYRNILFSAFKFLGVDRKP